MKNKMFIFLSALLIILALVYFVFKPDSPAEPAAQVSPFIWHVEPGEIISVGISLPRSGKSESWIKKEDLQWYFTDPDNSPVDTKRWDGGIPLLLSGPRSIREIPAEAGNEQQYGLDKPGMIIKLLLDTGETIEILLGDTVLDGSASYIKLAGEERIFTVDQTWVSVLEGLALDPPFQQ